MIGPPVNQGPAPVDDEQRKAENQRKAELLRAKLIAQRQHTPIKGASRSGTALKTSYGPKQGGAMKSESGTVNGLGNASVKDALGLESLIEEGRAAAAAAATATSAGTIAAAVAGTVAAMGPTAAQDRAVAQPARQPATVAEAETKQTEENRWISSETRPTSLSDAYYADLAAWLDFTGYHNVAYRTTKLRTYKERRALEEEAKRISERLEKLRREEEAEMNAMRSQVSHPGPSAADFPSPPPFPTEMPSKEAEVDPTLTTKLANGVKRRHSPSTVERISRQRNETGFRIRGAIDSPTASGLPPTSRHPSPNFAARRVGYPDGRRCSFDLMMRTADSPSRDPSLECRQAFYKNDVKREELAGDDRHGAYSSNRGFDQYYPREPPRFYGNNGRASSYNVIRQRHGYRGAAGLDLPKGG